MKPVPRLLSSVLPRLSPALLPLLLAGLLAGCGHEPRPDTVMSGEQVYQKYCVACHGRGLNGAPVYGDREAWAPKLAEGEEHLWQVVLNGEQAMPPRGLCQQCSDAELRAAFDYMLAPVR